MEVTAKEEILEFKFTHIFRCLLIAPSGSGKSQTILNIMKRMGSFFTQKYDFICYFYPMHSMSPTRKMYIKELLKHIPSLEVYEGLPLCSDVLPQSGSKLFLLDDLYYEAIDSNDFMNFCIQGSHQSDTSFFLTCQNLYQNSKYKASIFRQITDFIIWPFVGDHSMLAYLSSQLQGDRKFLPACMEWIKKNIANPHERYLWIALNIADNTDDKYRIRANFINNDPAIVFENVKK